MAILKLAPKQPISTLDREVSLEDLDDGRVAVKVKQGTFDYWVLTLNTDGTFSRVHGPGPDIQHEPDYDSLVIRESKVVKRPVGL